MNKKNRCILTILLLSIFISCNSANTSSKETKKDEDSKLEAEVLIRETKVMSDSVIDAGFSGFELGTDIKESVKHLDRLIKEGDIGAIQFKYKSRNNYDTVRVLNNVIIETGQSLDNIISVKGQEEISFRTSIYFKIFSQIDSYKIKEQIVECTLRFHNKKLYTIHILVFGDKKTYQVDRIRISDMYIGKYGNWYIESKNTIESLDYDKIIFSDETAYKCFSQTNNQTEFRWTFKNATILLCENIETDKAHQSTTISNITRNLINLINSTGSVRGETDFGRSFISEDKYSRERSIKSFVQYYDADDYNTWAEDRIYSTISSSFQIVSNPTEYSSIKYMTVYYIDNNIHNHLKDSLSNIEQTELLRKQKQLNDKQMRDSLAKDSIAKETKRRLNKGVQNQKI